MGFDSPGYSQFPPKPQTGFLRSSTKKFGHKSKQAVKEHQSELEKKIEVLEKQLEWEKLRTLALDTLINVAERELNISIRKKPGTKQPGS